MQDTVRILEKVYTQSTLLLVAKGAVAVDRPATFNDVQGALKADFNAFFAFEGKNYRVVIDTTGAALTKKKSHKETWRFISKVQLKKALIEPVAPQRELTQCGGRFIPPSPFQPKFNERDHKPLAGNTQMADAFKSIAHGIPVGESHVVIAGRSTGKASFNAFLENQRQEQLAAAKNEGGGGLRRGESLMRETFTSKDKSVLQNNRYALPARPQAARIEGAPDGPFASQSYQKPVRQFTSNDPLLEAAERNRNNAQKTTHKK